MISWTDSTLSFKDKNIFNNLNLEVKKNSKILLNSKSGSGKTTLLKTAIGLTPLDSGKIVVLNTILAPETIDKIRRSIFYLNQDITLPELPVKQLLDEIFLYKLNKNLKTSTKTLYEKLDYFELSRKILSKNVKELSGGERQRVGLIIGTLLDRPIWLLDEPTSALDKKLKEKVKNLVLELPITSIIISHDNCWDDLKKVSLGVSSDK